MKKEYFLMLEGDETYCYGENKREAFSRIPSLYTEGRNSDELIEIPKKTLEKIARWDIEDAKRDIEIMKGLSIQLAYTRGKKI